MRRQFGMALAKRMGWSREAADSVAEHVALRGENGLVAFELRWGDQGVVAGVVADDAVEADQADALAEAAEAELKMRTGRFGEVLPWS